jgi:tripartite-type tricarboxylate transporter receptor subunit TctC
MVRTFLYRLYQKPNMTQHKALFLWAGRALAAFTLFFSVVAVASAETADTYPNRPVRLIVGFTAGGTTDTMARLIAKELSTRLGQVFIVDNRPGANGNLGTSQVVQSAPDGYTLLLATISNATNASMYRNLPFDIQRDLVPVASLGIVPNVIVVPAASPFKSLEEYVAFARRNPGKLTYASAGSGSSTHLSGELFKSMAKVDLLHVPFKGSAPALTDLLGGQVDSMFDNLPASLPHIASGRLRALAITSPTRTALLPEVPTVAERGFTGYEAYSWTGMMAPKGTPDAVIQKLSASISKALSDPAVVAQMGRIGATPMQRGPGDFGGFVRDEIKKWAAIIQRTGATVD